MPATAAVPATMAAMMSSLRTAVSYAELGDGGQVVEPARDRGDEGGHGLQVAQVDDLVRRVHVAVRHADDAAADARPAQLDRVGVGPGRAGRGAELNGDALGLRHLADQVEHDRVDARAALDDGSAAELDLADLAL